MNVADSSIQKALRVAVDSFLPTKIAGWAIYKNSNDPVLIELLVNGAVVGVFRADMYRSDLVKIRADGMFAFRLTPFGANKWEPFIAKDARIELREKTSGKVISDTVWQGEAPNDQKGIVNSHGNRMRLNKGILVVPLSERAESWRRELLARAKRIAEESAVGGFYVSACYGTLLGAVREGALIGHDDDVDLMFISSASEIIEAIEEFQRYQDYLRSAGYKVTELSNGQIHVRTSTEFPVDIFLAWIHNGRLSLTFTVRAGVATENIYPLGQITLHGITLPAPRRPEALLEAIYGPSWREPDPAFYWHRPKDISDFFAPIHNYRRSANFDYWDKYYSNRGDSRPPQLPSQFALFALSVRTLPNLMVDLGCGNGRDSFFFASQGIKTIGLDYAHQAIEINTRKANEIGLAEKVRFYRADVSTISQAKKVIELVTAERTDAPICVYSRFFFHAIDENTEGAALLLIKHLLQRRGDYAALEFRTGQDAKLPKVTADHYRRYIDVDSFIRKANSTYGLACKYRVEGIGYAVFGNDDAHVSRLILENQYPTQLPPAADGSK